MSGVTFILLSNGHWNENRLYNIVFIHFNSARILKIHQLSTKHNVNYRVTTGSPRWPFWENTFIRAEQMARVFFYWFLNRIAILWRNFDTYSITTTALHTSVNILEMICSLHKSYSLIVHLTKSLKLANRVKLLIIPSCSNSSPRSTIDMLTIKHTLRPGRCFPTIIFTWITTCVVLNRWSWAWSTSRWSKS